MGGRGEQKGGEVGEEDGEEEEEAPQSCLDQGRLSAA